MDFEKRYRRKYLPVSIPVYISMLLVLMLAGYGIYFRFFCFCRLYRIPYRRLFIIPGLLIFGLVCSVTIVRTMKSMIAVSAITILIGDVMLLSFYFPYILCMFSFFALLSCTVSAIAAQNSACRVKGYRKRQRYYEYHAWKSSIIAMLILCLCCSFYGRKCFISRYGTSSQWKMTVSSKRGEDELHSLLDSNMSVLSGSTEKGYWMYKTQEQKREILQNYIMILCEYLGMKDSVPLLRFSELGETTLGCYERADDSVTITTYSKYRILDDYDAYEALRIISHEMFHRYSRYLSDLQRSVSRKSSFQELRLLEDARVYDYEFDHYIQGGEEGYREQALEQDAEEFADYMMGILRVEIERYWTAYETKS